MTSTARQYTDEDLQKRFTDLGGEQAPPLRIAVPQIATPMVDLTADAEAKAAEEQAALKTWSAAMKQYLADVIEYRCRYASYYLTQKPNVPPRLCDARLDRLPDIPAKLVDVVRAWTEDPHDSLTLLGKPGSGKTSVAVAVAAALLRTFHSGQIRFLHEGDFSVSNEFGTMTYDRAADNADVLIFDDLGASYASDLRAAAVERVIRGRHERMQATVITSNLTMNEIGQAFGGRVSSVLREFDVLSFPTADLRLKGTARSTRRAAPAEPTEPKPIAPSPPFGVSAEQLRQAEADAVERRGPEGQSHA